MKKIIDGLLYDNEADNVEPIAQAESTAQRGDFTWWKEWLYRTESGRFFLYGEGGPRSRYAKAYAGGASGSSDIRALSEDEAYDWMERHAPAHRTVDVFPDRVEQA